MTNGLSIQVPHVSRSARTARHDLRSFFTNLRSEIHARDVRSGVWYNKTLAVFVEYYAHRSKRRDLAATPPERRDAVARATIDRVALWSALAGSGAAAGVTAASVAMAQTSFLAAPAVLPLAGIGLLTELVLREVLHLELACELAEIYGMSFAPGSETELVRVTALALRAEMHETEDDPGRGLVERIASSEESGTLGKLVASSLVGESLLRNAVPFADIAVSSARNWQLVHQVGSFVQGYTSRRVVLQQAVARLAQRSPRSVELLIEGVWFIFISDGRLTGIETALLAYLMRDREISVELTHHFVCDEAEWLERLHELEAAPETRQLFLAALHVAAAVEKPVTASERAILTRVAQTLGVQDAEPPPTPEPVRAPQPTAAAQPAVAAATGAVVELGGDLTALQRAGEHAYAVVLGVGGWATRALHKLRTRPHVSTITFDATG